MHPIPESFETAAELHRLDPRLDPLARVQDLADEVRALVPDCIGLSVAWTVGGAAFTLVAPEEEIATLEAFQCLARGPGGDGVERSSGAVAVDGDLFDETRWRLSARATAHRGVASTVTMPLVEHGRTVGSVDLYGGSGRAFEGQHAELAEIFGAGASQVVRNADLAFSTRRDAERAPERMRARYDSEVAVGIVTCLLDVDVDSARRRIEHAALRAGTTTEQVARGLIVLHES